MRNELLTRSEAGLQPTAGMCNKHATVPLTRTPPVLARHRQTLVVSGWREGLWAALAFVLAGGPPTPTRSRQHERHQDTSGQHAKEQSEDPAKLGKGHLRQHQASQHQPEPDPDASPRKERSNHRTWPGAVKIASEEQQRESHEQDASGNDPLSEEDQRGSETSQDQGGQREDQQCK